MSFDPNSHDAMFSRILQRMDAQDAQLTRIEAGVQKTNGRVTVLENWRDVMKAKVAVFSTLISGVVAVAWWYVQRLFRAD